jgi:hypothetical protein
MKIEENILEKLKNEGNPFDVPQNYFDDFEAKLSLKMQTNESKVTVIQKLKPYLAIAASFAFVFTIWKIVAFYNVAPNEKFVSNQEQISDSIATDYELSSLSENEIVEILAEETVIEEDDAEQNAIIDYLIEEDISFSEIVEY